MNKPMTLAAVAVVALFAMPVGAAKWYSYGSYEPDTSFDTSTLMWDAPPAPGQLRIYFNAYSTMGVTGTHGTNPNVGTLETHIEPFGREIHYALLGIWTDCNGDGYVGAAESALREYPSQLLLDNSRCKPVTGPTTCWTNVRPCPDWPATGYNNYNGWVTELIPIAWGGPTSGDRRVIKDSGVAVWGDYGRPTDPGPESGGGTCALTPFPRGTMQSSGGALTYVDCMTGLLELWNLPWSSSFRVLGQEIPGVGDPLGLRFADDDDGRSHPTFGTIGTFGHDHSDNAIVHAGDCSDPEAYALKWPAGLPPAFYDNFGNGIRNPDTNYVNPNGNVAGTVNYTFEALPLPKVPGEGGYQSTSNCDFQDDRGQDVYFLEDDFNSVSVTDKRESDWNFEFTTMSRGGVPLGMLTGSAGAPNDAGITPIAGAVGEGPSEWFGGSALIKGPPQTVTTRGTIGGGDLEPVIAGAYWLSFYAFVKDAPAVTGAALPGGTGTYGSAQCGGFTSGVHNGWNCDTSLWNLNPDGTPVTFPHGTLAAPGKVYNLRDVDCYDGRIGSTGIGVLPAFYGDNPCA